MKFQWQILTVMAGFVAAGSAAVYGALRGALKHASEREDRLEREMISLSATVSMLEAKLAALHKPAEAPPALVEDREEATLHSLADAEELGQPQLIGVEAEMVAVLKAAACAALGRNVRLISARLAPAQIDKVNPWSQQGRVFVQASHNLR